MLQFGTATQILDRQVSFTGGGRFDDDIAILVYDIYVGTETTYTEEWVEIPGSAIMGWGAVAVRYNADLTLTVGEPIEFTADFSDYYGDTQQNDGQCSAQAVTFGDGEHWLYLSNTYMPNDTPEAESGIARVMTCDPATLTITYDHIIPWYSAVTYGSNSQPTEGVNIAEGYILMYSEGSDPAFGPGRGTLYPSYDSTLLITPTGLVDFSNPEFDGGLGESHSLLYGLAVSNDVGYMLFKDTGETLDNTIWVAEFSGTTDIQGPWAVWDTGIDDTDAGGSGYAGRFDNDGDGYHLYSETAHLTALPDGRLVAMLTGGYEQSGYYVSFVTDRKFYLIDPVARTATLLPLQLQSYMDAAFIVSDHASVAAVAETETDTRIIISTYAGAVWQGEYDQDEETFYDEGTAENTTWAPTTAPVQAHLYDVDSGDEVPSETVDYLEPHEPPWRWNWRTHDLETRVTFDTPAWVTDADPPVFDGYYDISRTGSSLIRLASNRYVGYLAGIVKGEGDAELMGIWAAAGTFGGAISGAFDSSRRRFLV